MTELAGTTVVVTRSAEESDSLGTALEALGAEVVRLPTIAIVFPPELLRGTKAAVKALLDGHFEWIVFSSSAGVRAFNNLLAHHRAEPQEVFKSVRVAAVGIATVAAFEGTARRRVDLVPARFTGYDLARNLGRGLGRVLLPRPEDAPRSLVEELESSGWEPVELPLYRTERGDPDPDVVARVKAGDFDVVTFTSGSTVRFFGELVGHPTEIGIGLQGTKKVVVIGPSTEAVAKEFGYRVDAIAEPHTTEGVVSAVVSVVGR